MNCPKCGWPQVEKNDDAAKLRAEKRKAREMWKALSYACYNHDPANNCLEYQDGVLKKCTRRNCPLLKGEGEDEEMSEPKEPDAILMLRVIEACIRSRLLPRKGSPCHNRIKSIIKEYEGEGEEMSVKPKPSKCHYADKYKGIRKPKCGCETCERLWVKRGHRR